MPNYASTGGGECATEGPLDICLIIVMDGPVPVPTPMPFSNMAMWTMAVGEPVALFQGMPACTMASVIELSQGDDEGILLGLISSTIMEEVMADDGSPVLLITGMPAADLGLSMTMHNMENAVGMYSVPSQTVATGV